MSKSTKILAVSFSAACIIVIVTKPETYIASASTGIKLWATTVVPSLLPFFFFTALLTATGITEKISEAAEKPCGVLFRSGGVSAYAFLMSVLSGYPVGAKIIGDLGENNLITPDEATRLSTFCSTSGPLFIIGSVGLSMFGNKYCGYLLFLSHVLSAFLTGVIFRFYGEKSSGGKKVLSRKTQSNVLYDCVYGSVVSIAVVGGFICVFYVAADAITNLRLLYPLGYLLNLIVKNMAVSSAYISGLIECTRGCKLLSLCGLSTYSLAFACSLISFGGVSVLFQSICFLKKAKVKTSVFIAAKITQSVISFGLCLLLYPLFVG